MHKRRRLLAAACSAAGLGACDFTLEDGVTNPCREPRLPDALARNEAVLAAWEGLNPAQMWDCHVHLFGNGDSGSGAWVTPDSASLAHPRLYVQRRLFFGAGCAGAPPGSVDEGLVARMRGLLGGMRPGAKAILLAFDWRHGEDGAPQPAGSPFHVPDAYALATSRRHPRHFEWAASIHPYRTDCVAALRAAAANGTRAVKWLPASMGMDPASPRCDPFFAELARLDLPLITHAGREEALPADEHHHLGNLLRLRRALEHGVRVVVAHCSTLGEDRDLDRGANGPLVPSFTLFERLMDDARYGKNLYGDLSAIAQVNRAGPPLARLIERADWHPRLLNGSDYPLPGVIPLYSMSRLTRLGMIEPRVAPVLAAIREHNTLLFDFVLKRSLRGPGGRQFSKSVFETRGFFEKRGS